MLAVDVLVFSTLSVALCHSDLVTVPKTLNTTNGLCLVIPCLLTISKEKEGMLDKSTVVTWRRGSLWSIYDSPSFNATHRQLEPLTEVVGDLQKKNCTSVMRNLSSLHSDRYFFRIQTNSFSMMETKAVLINVSDSMPEPTVMVPVIKEGEQVNLTCTVPAPCPSQSPNVTWVPALGGNITRETQLNADGTQSLFDIMQFVPSFHHHGLKVSCVSINPLHRDEKPLFSRKTIILHVEYPPKKTWISLAGWVWLGNNLTLKCLSNANPPAAHRWFRQWASKEEELGFTAQVISFTATRENSGEYICEAQNQLGGMNSTKLLIDVPGTYFIALLSILGVFLLLMFAVILCLIYRRCKGSKKRVMNENQNIYTNVSSSPAETQQLQLRPCGGKDICTFDENDPEESIYANC
ncbi:sialic acid-binding Ig-like lectin 7 [Xyrauchen texanus]|uniref:sialic acid-binding Ig-like lectin 7 n=1 Tax=Xyrauchen texanus TaxID=154827 RepID=UPI0022424B7F|nr:sialic acid-binding Ig-like lectin 7 [Xyrauchen texanus]